MGDGQQSEPETRVITRRNFIKGAAVLAAVTALGGIKWWESSVSPENQNQRTIEKIISEGVTKYNEKTGKKVSYRRTSDFKPDSYYDELILKNLGDKDKIINEFPFSAKDAYLSADSNFDNYAAIVSQVGSGFYTRFERENPFGNNANETYKKRMAVGEKYFAEVKQNIENLVSANENKPISASQVLEYFLEKNQGSLDESIYDTAIF